MASVTRNMTIEYGSVTIGGTLSGAKLSLHSLHSLNRDETSFDLQATVLVTAGSEAVLAAGCSSLETAFTTRRQDVRVLIGGSTFVDFRHSTNTALNIRAGINKAGSPADSGLSRLYDISVSGDTSLNSPPQTSSLSVTYGTTTIPGSVGGANVSLHEIHTISRDQDNFEVSLSVLVKAATSSILATACESLEDVFTTRRLDLVASMAGSTIMELRHSTNAALNTTASINKIGSPLDSELTRIYQITVSGEVPTKAALNALRSFNYEIAYSPSRRTTLTTTGTYTALGGNQASAQYLAAIDTRADAIITSLGGTWELLTEDYTPDDTDQLVNFSRTYQTLLYSNASTLFLAGIRNQTLSISVDKVGAEGLADENKLISVTATYSASVDKTVSKNLNTLWSSVVKPYILTEVERVLENKTYALVKENKDLDHVENRISGSLEIRGKSASGTITHTVTATDEIDMGKIIARTWPTEDVDEIRKGTKAYVYQGPKTITRTISEAVTSIGLSSMPAPNGGGGDRMPSATGLGEAQIASLVAHEGVLTKFSESQTPKTLGTGTKTMLLTERSKTWVYEFFESEEGAGKIVKSVSPTPSGPSGSYKAAGG